MIVPVTCINCTKEDIYIEDGIVKESRTVNRKNSSFEKYILKKIWDWQKEKKEPVNI